jgi:hypothetical protein
MAEQLELDFLASAPLWIVCHVGRKGVRIGVSRVHPQ